MSNAGPVVLIKAADQPAEGLRPAPNSQDVATLQQLAGAFSAAVGVLGKSVGQLDKITRELQVVPFADVAPASAVVEQVMPRERSEPHSRALNVVLALVGMICVAPLILLIALAVKLTSRGPVLYSQSRIGVDRRFRFGRSDDPHGDLGRNLERRARPAADLGQRRDGSGARDDLKMEHEARRSPATRSCSRHGGYSSP